MGRGRRRRGSAPWARWGRMVQLIGPGGEAVSAPGARWLSGVQLLKRVGGAGFSSLGAGEGNDKLYL